jgi:RNA ligase
MGGMCYGVFWVLGNGNALGPGKHNFVEHRQRALHNLGLANKRMEHGSRKSIHHVDICNRTGNKVEYNMSVGHQLLTRDQFREGVFARDNHLCVLCGDPAQDAHHILERRLWPDGGYYLNNGASVCGHCHMRCERTEVSVQQVREACGITKPIIPPHLYGDLVYDKWGNIELSNGTRLRGELFYDESVQKVLRQGGVLELFTNRVKYPRTHHLPWSQGKTEDDRVMEDLSGFENQRVIVTRKMDGENTSIYGDGLHARSINGRNHASRDWVKNFWSRIAGDIPQDWRICGENLYAKHSIAYADLPSYFMGFSIWNERNECLDWDSTLEWFDLLGIAPVPVLYDGMWDAKLIQGLYDSKRDYHTHEGYVVRTAAGFGYGDFRRCVAKFVRADHVATTAHWMHGQPIIPNQLSSKLNT